MSSQLATTQSILLLSFDRWLDLNEYEGLLNLQVGPWELQARTILNPREWDALHPGQSLSGEVYLQAYRDAEPTKQPPGWVQEDGVNYSVTGMIAAHSGDDLTLALPGGTVRVDLDGHALNAVVNEVVTIRGEVDFETEDSHFETGSSTPG